MRWASAVSDKPSLEQAIDACVSSIGGEFAERGLDLAVAFVTAHHAAEYERAPGLVQEALGARVFLGCSAGGVIGGGTEVEHRPGFALTVAHLPGVELHPIHLEKSDLPNASDLPEETRAVLAKLNPVCKTLLYAGEFPPNLTSRERQALTREVRKRLRNEYPHNNVPAEGMDGIPTRILQNVFADICEDDAGECITPFAVFKLLDKVVDQGAINYDFLSRQRDDGYHDFLAFTAVLRQRYDEIIAAEIENSIIDVDPSDIDERIHDYLRNVTAYNRKEKLKNDLTGEDIEPDEKRMKQIEDLLDVEESERDFFRFRMVSRLTNALTTTTSTLTPGSPPIDLNLREIYTDVYKVLHRSLYRERRDEVNWSDIKRALVKSAIREQFDKISEQAGETAHSPSRIRLDNMDKTYGYCYECDKPIILYFIDKRLGQS